MRAPSNSSPPPATTQWATTGAWYHLFTVLPTYLVHSHIFSIRDDFLGDYNGVERGEDRMFSTALAINTLIDVWSVPATYALTQ